MKQEIMQALADIEDRHNVTILLACESGSRAWGFPSADSDYDVRFIYVHKTDWYLSIADKRDVIELPIDDLLDINGWDIKKALGLLRKSNPALLEWLSSPIVYQKHEELLQPILDLSEKAFLQESACHHYLSMATNNMKAYINKDKTKLKKYLYTVRPLLCCQWVIDHGSQPPMLFNDLLERYLPEGETRKVLDDLLIIKQSSNETDLVERNAVLERYIDHDYARLGKLIPKNPEKSSIEVFDQTFKTILELNNHGKSH